MNSGHIVIRKLLLFGELSPEEQHAFLDIIEPPQTVPAGQTIVEEGSRPQYSTVLLDGFACRYKTLVDGQRQIFSFQISGDIADIHSYVLKLMDHSVMTLTQCVIACIPHERIRAVIRRYPNLAEVMWRDTLVESAVFREWLAAMGRLPAVNRVAHLLCEQFARMKAVGLVAGNTVSLPLTQTDIADALGMSVVHANRTLQELRRLRLIELKSRTLTVLNWEQLAQIGVFDQKYLHFRETRDYA
jgi:CRP-like cAMP-binding protein